MKDILYKTAITFFLGAVNFIVFPQDGDVPFKGTIIAGTNQWFLISTSDQSPVKAKIVSIEGNHIIIKEKSGGSSKIDRNTILNIEKIPYGKLGTFGVGFGIPYGTLGINVEFNLVPYLSVTGGLGTTIFSGLGYSIGLKGYFRKPGKVWRPRASIYYGINGLYAEDINHPDNKKYTGITAGLGQLFLWKKHGFDLDLIYLITSKLWEEHSGGGRIKLSIGYRYAF